MSDVGIRLPEAQNSKQWRRKMGLYQYVREAWKKPQESMPELWHERLIAWRAEPATVRLDHPTRIDRARSLGYKAKPGFIIVRQRVLRGGHKRARFSGGRRSKRFHLHKNLNLSYQTIAERRANEQFPNCEVLNSYYLAKDGKHEWYEIILVDPQHPVIKADPRMMWINKGTHRGRIYRGLTASARRSRKRTTM
jgi:large subunit ribosomal protein L15e